MMILLFLGEIRAYVSNIFLLFRLGVIFPVKTKIKFEIINYLALNRCVNHHRILIDHHQYKERLQRCVKTSNSSLLSSTIKKEKNEILVN
jgi:hypothetical protein